MQRSVGLPQVFVESSLAFPCTFPEVELPLIVFDLQPFVWGRKGGKGSFKKGGAAGSPNSSGEDRSPLGFRGQEGLRDQESLLESGFFSPCAAGGRCQGAAAGIWGRGGFFLPCSGGQPSSQVSLVLILL